MEKPVAFDIIAYVCSSSSSSSIWHEAEGNNQQINGQNVGWLDQLLLLLIIIGEKLVQ